MKRQTLVLSLVLAFAVSLIIISSFAVGQGGLGQPPPNKIAFEATQAAMMREAEKRPTADPKIVPDRLTPLLTPRSSCPNTRIKTMIYDYTPMGPSGESGIINVAVVIKNDVAYSILAGSPTDLGNQGIVILKQLGMIIVRQEYVDPCAATLAGKTSASERNYVTQRGPLAITQIEGDAVVLKIAGTDTDRFNFITGQFANLTLVVTPTSVPFATPTSRAYP